MWRTGSPHFRDVVNACFLEGRGYGLLAWDSTSSGWSVTWMSGQTDTFTTPALEEQRREDMESDGEEYRGEEHPYLPTSLKWMPLP